MKKLTVDEAVSFLRNGFLVVVPTETVYGLAADGISEESVRKLYRLKGRPKSNPIMLQVSDMVMLDEIVAELPDEARKLIDAFWPGPLTLVLPKRVAVSDILSAGTGNIGVRMPDQVLTLEIIRKTGRPLAVPSANLSGRPAPISPEEVETALGLMPEGDPDLAGIVDAGVCRLGEASTVLDLTGCCQRAATGEVGSGAGVGKWKILRDGPVKREDIESLIGLP